MDWWKVIRGCQWKRLIDEQGTKEYRSKEGLGNWKFIIKFCELLKSMIALKLLVKTPTTADSVKIEIEKQILDIHFCRQAGFYPCNP